MATRQTRQIRAALVGCGRIGERHGTILSAHPEIELVATIDVIAERAAAYAGRFGGRPYAELGDAIAAEHPELVVVCTPSGLHPPVVIAAAQAGVPNIVSEKPMALRLDEADAMIAACDAAGARLFVVQQNRYNPPIRMLREALDAGRLGRLVMGTVRCWWARHQEYYDHDPWRGTWELDGGAVANQASHYVDMLSYMMGDVEVISAVTATRLARIQAEDTAVATLRFANGALGVIEATTAARPTNIEGSIAILGERGTVEIGGFAMNEVRRWVFDEPTESDGDIAERSRTTPPDVYGFGHHAYLADVVETILSDGAPVIDGREGRKSLEVIVGLYESAASGRPVSFPVVTKASPLGRHPDETD